MIDDEQCHGDDRAGRGNGEQRAPPDIDHAIGVVVPPGGDGDQEQARRPGSVDDATLLVRARRRTVEVGAVGEGDHGERCAEECPGAPRAPAGECEAADDEREEDHVGERVGNVRGDDGRGALGRLSAVRLERRDRGQSA